MRWLLRQKSGQIFVLFALDVLFVLPLTDFSPVGHFWLDSYRSKQYSTNMPSPTEVVRNEYDSQRDAMKNQILVNDFMRENFVGRIVREYGFERRLIVLELEKISAIQSGEIDQAMSIAENEKSIIEKLGQADQQADQAEKEAFLKRKLAEVAVLQNRIAQGVPVEQAEAQEITPAELNQALAQVDTDYRLNTMADQIEKPKLGTDERSAYSRMMSDIISTLKSNPSGLTKTEILVKIKRNGTHRQMRDEILIYLQAKNKVRKIGNKFIHITNTGKILETSFHRKIYESLAQGPQSVNAIVTKRDEQGNLLVGYNNATGRSKVKQVLTLLWREGMISRNTKGQWYIPNLA